jgi:hypothetical protein
MVVALGLAFRPVKQTGDRVPGPSTPVLFGLGCQYCGREEPWVEVRHDEDGSYQATLCGHFTIRVPGDHPFRVRMLMLFLRLLHPKGTRPGPSRRSRRTRDGRTPFVRQVQAAAWFGLPHPDISRVEGYWYRGDWPELFTRAG